MVERVPERPVGSRLAVHHEVEPAPVIDFAGFALADQPSNPFLHSMPLSILLSSTYPAIFVLSTPMQKATTPRPTLWKGFGGSFRWLLLALSGGKKRG